MRYDTIIVQEQPKIVTITLNRVASGNSVNVQLLKEINHALDYAESHSPTRIVVIAGKDGIFSSGMDLAELAGLGLSGVATDALTDAASLYFRTLTRLTLMGKLVVAFVDGRANAAGIGLAAASDVVIASDRSTFSLSEAFFGLIPANVVPFLVRRVGFQRAYLMALLGQQINAPRALEIGLADELAKDSGAAVRRLLVRVDRIQEKTLRATKTYFRKMWLMNDETEKLAVAQISELLQDAGNINGIRRFVETGVFPWQQEFDT